ncbi:hypothetical protein KFE25_005759 [Diacronema lutheri]|uniref:PUB domain-containing protein n=1 Tax=Diacronema lutheri TaxID=2081491 RepID=A0A8J6C3U2_DIALT|nr:hypothetical protein KFE25_005759 [Diacronema lutheri]
MAAAPLERLPESDDRVREVRRCVEVIRDHKLSDASSSIATMRTLEKIFANIDAAPDEPKFRRIRLTNPKVAKLLGAKGVQPLLLKAGWRRAVEQMEEAWIHDGGADALLLVRTTRHILGHLATLDEQAHAAAERQRAESLTKMSRQREVTLAEVKADHERRLERAGKLNHTMGAQLPLLAEVNGAVAGERAGLGAPASAGPAAQVAQQRTPP